MQIVHQLWTRFNRIVESVLDAMEKGLDYVSFEENLREQLNESGGSVQIGVGSRRLASC